MCVIKIFVYNVIFKYNAEVVRLLNDDFRSNINRSSLYFSLFVVEGGCPMKTRAIQVSSARV